jgi:pimeloyl-ACP methyl ester carboxylesterase
MAFSVIESACGGGCYCILSHAISGHPPLKMPTESSSANHRPDSVMKILYLHGWNSIPFGVKPAYLAGHGLDLLQPELPNDDFGEAVRVAQAELDNHRPALVVGSSRGGAIAMNLQAGDIPLVLLCPAWKRWGTARTVKAGTLILHAREDDVVPFADSLELLANSDLPLSALIVTGHDHRLASPESLQTLLAAVEQPLSAGAAVARDDQARRESK